MAFEFDGAKYQKASTHQKEWGAKLISEFDFKGDERILDLGCGDGSITANLANHVPNGFVLGIDASNGMIETAKENYKRPNLDFELLDINAINFSNEFDIIISNATLHWVKDHCTLLEHVYAALRSNGIVRFNFAADGNCSFFYKVVKEIMQYPELLNYFEAFEWPWYMPAINDYQALAEQSSFSNIKIWGENSDRYFPSSKEMIMWIDQPSIVPFLKCIPSEKASKAFRDTVIEKMVQETLQNDGTCFETFRRINLKAVK